jgi:hypothetical protein
MQPETQWPLPLERRTPGETDLSVFTTTPEPTSRHRVDQSRTWLRVVRDPESGRPALQSVVLIPA